MKTLFIALLFSYGLTHSQASTRQIEADSAAETFMNWHFFENGRGMTLSPNMSRLLWMIGDEQESPINDFLQKRYGLLFRKGKMAGVFNVKYKGMDVGVLGCTACHSGKAAGIFVAGLGNKTIDSYTIGKDFYLAQRFWGWGPRSKDYKYIHEKSQNFSKVISDSNISNLTRGLVADATIKTFFYKDQGIPYPKNLERAQVKVPHLWGIKEKRPHGVFNDGSLDGEGYAWIFGAELFASDSGEHLRAVLPKIVHLTDNVLGKLLPPPYPFNVNKRRAEMGKTLFQNNCIRCHGDHDRDNLGYPIYTAPKVIPWAKVKTDKKKIDSIDDEFIDLVESGSLRDLLSFNKENIRKGYFAPKLWGIWARFPYLHNGSIPNLYQIMMKPEKRDEVFSMQDAGEAHRFDKVFAGLTLIPTREKARALKKAKQGDRNLYYVKRHGQSNSGHYFPWFEDLSHQDKMKIIEYLKTL